MVNYLNLYKPLLLRPLLLDMSASVQNQFIRNPGLRFFDVIFNNVQFSFQII
jgi:uncharacterized membrane protein SpoIIM required for sporulation